MSEASVLSPIISQSSSSPNPKLRRRRRSPILRGYLKPPPKPLLSDVRRDITSSQDASSSSVDYYAFLASKLASSGRLQDFIMVSESVLSSGDSDKFVAKISVNMVSEGIVEALEQRELDRVIEFVKEVKRAGMRACTLFDESAMEALKVQCRRLVKEGRLNEFVEITEILADHQFPIQGIIDPIHVIKKFVYKRDLNTAMRYASIYPHSQLLFCTIIEEFGKKNDLQNALKVFEELKKQPGGINMFAFRCIIDVCGICGDFNKSRSIFEGLIKEEIMPNVFVFNSLMNVNAHDLNYNLEMYKRMQELGIQADLITYNILLKSCCNSRRVDLALKIYEEIKSKNEKGSLKLNIYTFSWMIKVLSEAEMWNAILTIKTDMISCGVRPNLTTWTSFIKSCANSGNLNHALKLFDEMQNYGFTPNSQICNIILHACVKALQFDRAFRFFYLWKDFGIKLEFEGSNLGEFRADVATLNTLMKACGKDYHKAKVFMREMKKLGVYPDKFSWSILVDICGKAQNFKGALLAFNDMKECGIVLDVTAFNTIIKACVDNKKVKLAFSIFREMKRYKLRPDRVTYNTLLRARSKYGSLHEVQQSLSIYQEMRKAGYSPNDIYLKELIEEWCEGVLCNQNPNPSPNLNLNLNLNFNSKKNFKKGKPYHILLEKVATYLSEDKERNQLIDVRGLSKVEARIIVLSVLRMIKENYLLGKSIEENMVIISGGESESLEVQNAIIHVLKNELGLKVLTGYGNKSNMISPDPLSHEVNNIKGEFKHLTRRPKNLGVITVPVESIHEWLHKKTVAKEIHT